MTKRFMVTGGAGFIGSAVVRHLIQHTSHAVMVVDNLTYAANLDSLRSVSASPNYSFEEADICDAGAVKRLMASFKPDIMMHLAAESHVDRSIDGPAQFIETNVVGTFTLLEAALDYWRALPGPARERFRFHHISTDEVFGSLGADGYFTRGQSATSRTRPIRHQGRLGSSGARLAPHLRPAGRALQLLEQLRAATSFPRS